MVPFFFFSGPHASGINSPGECISEYLSTHLDSYGLKPTRLACGRHPAGDLAEWVEKYQPGKAPSTVSLASVI